MILEERVVVCFQFDNELVATAQLPTLRMYVSKSDQYVT